MARNTTVTLTAGAWTLLNATGESVSAMTFQNRGLAGNQILEPIMKVKGTATESAPSDDLGAIEYEKGDGCLSSIALSVLWPGISAGFVYAYCDTAIDVMVSHA